MSFYSGLVYAGVLRLTGVDPVMCVVAGVVVSSLVWFFLEKDSYEVPQKAR